MVSSTEMRSLSRCLAVTRGCDDGLRSRDTVRNVDHTTYMMFRKGLDLRIREKGGGGRDSGDTVTVVSVTPLPPRSEPCRE